MALAIRKVSKDQLPKTNVPGRTRQPSDFDEIMEEAFGDSEWRAVNFDGTEENLNHLLSELNRSAIYFNYGKSVRGGLDENDEPTRDEDGNPVFYFQIREKLKTGPRGPRAAKTTDSGGDIEIVEGGEADSSTPSSDDDAGLSGIAESLEAAKTTTKSRKGRLTGFMAGS